MVTDPDWVPPGVDTKRANSARVYDYLLGGTHNFLADQDVARTLIAVGPMARVMQPCWRPDPPGPPDSADQISGALAGVARKP